MLVMPMLMKAREDEHRAKRIAAFLKKVIIEVSLIAEPGIGRSISENVVNQDRLQLSAIVIIIISFLFFLQGMFGLRNE